MKVKIAKYSLAVMGIAFILGLTLIFSSAAIGESKGNKAIVANGGIMDTAQYERIIEGNTASYRTGGLVLSLVGGFGTLLSGYALYNEFEENSSDKTSTKGELF